VLDEEARPAHELVRLLGQHLRGRLGPVLGVRCLLVLFLVLGDDQALLEDHVEAGLDILLVVLVLLLVLLVLGAIRGDGGGALPVLLRLLLLLLDLLVLVDLFFERVLVDEVVVRPLVEIGLVEFLFLVLFFFVQLVVDVFGLCSPSLLSSAASLYGATCRSRQSHTPRSGARSWRAS